LCVNDIEILSNNDTASDFFKIMKEKEVCMEEYDSHFCDVDSKHEEC
jgi:hypothetical protein